MSIYDLNNKIEILQTENKRLLIRNFGLKETLVRYGYRGPFNAAEVITKKDETIKQLEAIIRNINEQFALASKELTQLRETNTQSSIEIGSLKFNSSTAREEFKKLNERLDEKLNEIEKLTKEKVELSDELQSLMSQKLSQTANASDFMDKYNSLKEQLQSETTRHRNERDLYNRKIKEYEDNIAEMKKAIMSLSVDKLNLANKLKEMTYVANERASAASEYQLKLKEFMERPVPAASISPTDDLIKVQSTIKEFIEVFNETIMNKSLVSTKSDHAQTSSVDAESKLILETALEQSAILSEVPQDCAINIQVAFECLRAATDSLNGNKLSMIEEVDTESMPLEANDDYLQDILKDLPNTPSCSPKVAHKLRHRRPLPPSALHHSISIPAPLSALARNATAIVQQIEMLKNDDVSFFSEADQSHVADDISMLGRERREIFVLIKSLVDNMIRNLQQMPQNFSVLESTTGEQSSFVQESQILQYAVEHHLEEPSCSISRDVTNSQNRLSIDDEDTDADNKTENSFYHSTALKKVPNKFETSSFVPSMVSQDFGASGVFGGQPLQVEKPILDEDEVDMDETKNQQVSASTSKFTISIRREDLQMLRSEVVKLERELDKKCKECEELQKGLQIESVPLEQYNQLKEQLASKTAEYHELVTKIELGTCSLDNYRQLQEELDSKQKGYEKLSGQISAYNAQNSDLVKIKHALEEERATWNQEKNRLVTQIAEVNVQQQSLQLKLESANQTKLELTDEVEQLREEISQLEQELDKNHFASSENMERLTVALRDINGYRDELARVGDLSKKHEQEHAAWVRERTSLITDYEDLRSQVESLGQMNVELSEQLEHLRLELNEMCEQLETKNDECQVLTKQINDLQNQLEAEIKKSSNGSPACDSMAQELAQLKRSYQIKLCELDQARLKQERYEQSKSIVLELKNIICSRTAKLESSIKDNKRLRDLSIENKKELEDLFGKLQLLSNSCFAKDVRIKKLEDKVQALKKTSNRGVPVNGHLGMPDPEQVRAASIYQKSPKYTFQQNTGLGKTSLSLPPLGESPNKENSGSPTPTRINMRNELIQTTLSPSLSKSKSVQSAISRLSNILQNLETGTLANEGVIDSLKNNHSVLLQQVSEVYNLLKKSPNTNASSSMQIDPSLVDKCDSLIDEFEESSSRIESVLREMSNNSC